MQVGDLGVIVSQYIYHVVLDGGQTVVPDDQR